MDRDNAALARDIGMARSTRSADSAQPAWSADALERVRRYARLNKWFMAEEVRVWASANGFADPPNAKAWGSVMKKAMAAGIVRADGYAPANSSNLSPKVRWKSMIFSEAA